MKSIKFNDKSNVYKIVDNCTQFVSKEHTKTWSGLRRNTFLFETMMNFVLEQKEKEFEMFLNTKTIFDLHILKEQLKDLTLRIVETFNKRKPSLPILKGGGGKNVSLLLNTNTFFFINSVHVCLDNYINHLKSKSVIYKNPNETFFTFESNSL